MKTTAYALANITAMLGGLVLVAIILMTVISVSGRALIGLGLGPIMGDFELTELGIAFAIFCFLPLCQLMAGHATVDVFTSGLSVRGNLVLLALWDVILTVTALFIAWRLGIGLLDKMGNRETTMLLRVPMWWGYGAALLPACVGVIVGLWSAYDRVLAAMKGTSSRGREGAQH